MRHPGGRRPRTADLLIKHANGGSFDKQMLNKIVADETRTDEVRKSETRKNELPKNELRKSKMRTLILLVTASILISGCSVGPNYHRPVVQTPGAYRDLQENRQASAQTASYADLPWWQVFQDTQLQELIRTALKQNYDLQLAAERINAARAQVAISRSRLFPQVQGNGDFSGGKEHNFQTK